MKKILYKAWFTLIRNKKKQKKIIYWCPENPCAVPLHGLEVGIWCQVGVHKIISPVLLF
jgi:hypothetical protein